jgi:hypothetical protein
MRRLHVTRAALAGVAAVVAGVAVAYVIAPPFGAPRVDPIGRLATRIAGVPPADRLAVGLTGWALALAAGQLVAFVFAALWDVVPPSARPVSKAVAFCALLFTPGFVLLGLPAGAIPAALAFALALGLVYRPHPAATPPIARHPLRPRAQFE